MRAKIAIIDYGMGNLRSVARAMQTTGADVRIITAPAEMTWADGVVFPARGDRRYDGVSQTNRL